MTPHTADERASGADGLEIGRAGAADVDGVATLLQANAPSRGGTLTGEFPRERVAAWVDGPMPVIVARRAGRVSAVLITGRKEDAAAPVARAMLRAWPGRPDAYTYGPVCIDASERGHGVLERLYAHARHLLPGREAILFIRRDNAASLRAHHRLGMHDVASFQFDGHAFVVLSDGA